MDLKGVGAEKLRRMVDILVAEADPERTILFGFARAGRRAGGFGRGPAGRGVRAVRPRPGPAR